ncbi:MAG: flagellar motor switch protein FliN [Planctomycetales bacterium]
MSDDLLDPSEIDKLLQSGAAGAGQTPSPAPASESAAASNSDEGLPVPDKQILSQNDLDALFQQVAGAPKAAAAAAVVASQTPARGSSATDDLLNRMEQDLASVLAGEGGQGGFKRPPASLGSPESYSFANFDSRGVLDKPENMNFLEEVQLDLRIELGRTELLVEEVLKLREGAVVPLDKLAGDPVDVLVNGRLIARGEVLVLNDNFCVRIAEILAPTF